MFILFNWITTELRKNEDIKIQMRNAKIAIQLNKINYLYFFALLTVICNVTYIHIQRKQSMNCSSIRAAIIADFHKTL